jgi:hypothetical protein
MAYHVLPTLPDPPHDHEMAHDTPDPDGVPPDIGTGGAGFLIACLVLAITLLMGVTAISQLKGGSLFASNYDSAAQNHMQSPQMRATPASATMR